MIQRNHRYNKKKAQKAIAQLQFQLRMVITKRIKVNPSFLFSINLCK
ncbi:hypothetical protein SC936_08770 [Aggregatibacter actinomycetemcomitans serotype e str. SC936]|nr:hypothetical protein SA3096_09290 [Aggregatibacter actinomycetemcomitans serotype e str. SA3096]KYK78644.1 hypothetical protein SC936_08770 [Aggregatibacter actinomycetemcomitans serotype e str. SC936]